MFFVDAKSVGRNLSVNLSVNLEEEDKKREKDVLVWTIFLFCLPF